MNRSAIIHQGQRLLRPTTETDLDYIVQAEALPENAFGITPWTVQQHRDIISGTDGAHLMLESEGAGVGYLIFRGLDNASGSVELMRIVITQKRAGHGRAALRLAQRIAFEHFSAHRLWLDVFTDNLHAWRLYESEGFVREGILRECFKGSDGYRSLVILSVLKSDFEAR